MLDKLNYNGLNGIRAVERWVIPYLNSCLRADGFRPALSNLFADWKCNKNCHCCFQYDNTRPGMSLETTRSAIDWLKSIGCRVIPLIK